MSDSNLPPKRKGKVAAVKRAGFASRYLGIPYVFTNSWKAYVYLLVVKCVGAVGQLSGTFSIIAYVIHGEREREIYRKSEREIQKGRGKTDEEKDRRRQRERCREVKEKKRG